MQLTMKTAGPAPKPSDKPVHQLLTKNPVACMALDTGLSVLVCDGPSKLLFTPEDRIKGERVDILNRQLTLEELANMVIRHNRPCFQHLNVLDVATGRNVIVVTSFAPNPVFAAREPQLGI